MTVLMVVFSELSNVNFLSHQFFTNQTKTRPKNYCECTFEHSFSIDKTLHFTSPLRCLAGSQELTTTSLNPSFWACLSLQNVWCMGAVFPPTHTCLPPQSFSSKTIHTTSHPRTVISLMAVLALVYHLRFPSHILMRCYTCSNTRGHTSSLNTSKVFCFLDLPQGMVFRQKSNNICNICSWSHA